MADIVDISVEDVEKRRLPSKHYVYVIVVTKADGFRNVIHRRYSRFFELQCRILDRFPVEAGRYNPSERILPFLPGKILFGRSHVRAVALKRLQAIDSYCKELLKLKNVMDSPEVVEFFDVSEEDLDPEESVEKIKTKKNIDFEAKEISGPVLNEQYVAIATYEKDGLQEVGLAAGEMVDVIEKSENGWWFVSAEDGQGWAPSSFLERTDGLEEDTASPLQTGEGSSFVCTKNYAPQFDDEVRLNKGLPVEVIEKNLNGWWKVRSGEVIGQAPATYLAKTDTVRAKRIMGITDKVSGEAKIPQRLGKNVIHANHLVRPFNDLNSNAFGLPFSPQVLTEQQSQENNNAPPKNITRSDLGGAHFKNNKKNNKNIKRSLEASLASKKKQNKPLPALPLPGQKTKQLPAIPITIDEDSDSDSDSDVNYENFSPPPRKNTIRREAVKLPERNVEPIYISVSDFVGHAPGTMNLQEGVQVKVIDKNVTGWSYVEVGSEQGWVPTDIIKRKDPLTKKVSPARPPLPKGRSSPQPSISQAGPVKALSPKPIRNGATAATARPISPGPTNPRPTSPRPTNPRPPRTGAPTPATRSTSPKPVIPSSQTTKPVENELQQKLNARREGQGQGRAIAPEPLRTHNRGNPGRNKNSKALVPPLVNKPGLNGQNHVISSRWVGPLTSQSQGQLDSDSDSDNEYKNENELDQARVKFITARQNKPRQLPIPPNQANKPRPVLPQKKPCLPEKPKPTFTNGSKGNQSSRELNVRAMRNRFEQS